MKDVQNKAAGQMIPLISFLTYLNHLFCLPLFLACCLNVSRPSDY